jgi:uncharacterized protein
MDSYINLLKYIFEKNNICSSHGIDHAICVMNNAKEALNYVDITDKEKELVLIASLLHDADDKKFFPENKNLDNLVKIMQDNGHDSTDINLVKYMVELVSCSKNGDNIPEDVKDRLWMLIPRYADRLEAIGMIGIIRCYKYTKTINPKLFTQYTPIPKTEEDIWKFATQERYDLYDGKSVSMIDHFYDKLLRLSHFPIRNVYFDEVCREKTKILIHFLLYFAEVLDHNDDFTCVDVEKFINS